VFAPQTEKTWSNAVCAGTAWLHEKRIEPELSPEREAKLATRCAQETGSGAAEAKPKLHSSNRARTQKGAEAKKENKLARSVATSAANRESASLTDERTNTPNEK
jgi:hypothetical protein